MKKTSNHYSFLIVGKTEESSEASEGFKKYIGVGASKVLAINPTKAELEKIYGREIQNDPEYTVERDDVKGTVVDIIVQTDPELCGGVDIINHLRFNLFPTKAFNKDQSKVRVVDNYGNAQWMNVDDANAHKACLTANGDPQKIDKDYRISFVGEVDILDFLRKFLFNKDSFSMPNNVWTKKDDADDVIIGFEDPKKLLNGSVAEIKELIALQPNNKIKLLYGVKRVEDAQTGKVSYRQTVCANYDMMLRNNATASAFTQLEKNLNSAKAAGMYGNIEYAVQELKEWDVQPTNLTKSSTAAPTAAPAPKKAPWD